MTAQAEKKPSVLFFDSGLGGLSVLKAMLSRYPGADYTYLADHAGFPYGGQSEPELVARVTSLIRAALARKAADLCVIACNTASTLVLPPLRANFALPFVGTVPAIKPACQMSESKMISVLATPATVERDYTHQLIDRFAKDCEVNLVGSEALARLVENRMTGTASLDEDVLAEITPAFLEKAGRRTDLVVLACTHFPLILDDLVRLALWPVTWLDSGEAITRRAISLLGSATGQEGSIEFLHTGDALWPDLKSLFAEAESVSLSEPVVFHHEPA